MSGPLLDLLYDTNRRDDKVSPLRVKIFGVSIFCDDATITNVPLINILIFATSPNNLFALLYIVIVQIKWLR